MNDSDVDDQPSTPTPPGTPSGGRSPESMIQLGNILLLCSAVDVIAALALVVAWKGTGTIAGVALLILGAINVLVGVRQRAAGMAQR